MGYSEHSDYRGDYPMALHSARIIDPGARPNILLSSGQRVNSFHGEGTCAGDFCPVHKPSDHHLLEFPLAFTGRHMVRIISELPVSSIMGVDIAQIEGPQLVTIDPDDFFLSQTGKAIIRNSAICSECGEHIVSHSQHDYRTCICEGSSVDGGPLYLKRSGSAIDTSIVFTLPGFEDTEEDEEI